MGRLGVGLSRILIGRERGVRSRRFWCGFRRVFLVVC